MSFNFWTAADREQWVNTAVNSTAFKGYRGPYQYCLIPKNNGIADQDDPSRSIVTDALADVVYNSDASYRSMSIGIYDLIVQRIMYNPFLREFFMRDILVLIKGGNAYSFLVPNNPELPFSDLDIVIMINPALPKQLFDQIRSSLRITVFQCLSQHKRTLDNMLFSEHADNEFKYKWMSEDKIEMFKMEHITAMQAAGFVSPFESKTVRNFCSRNSFMLKNSNNFDDKIVRVETPHFEQCDRIPLRKSPIFCSHNSTISFAKDGYTRNFELFRMRFNNMRSQATGQIAAEIAIGEDDSVKLNLFPKVIQDRVCSDFIDISINAQDDTENTEFWQMGRCVMLRDLVTGIWLGLPDIHTCIHDVWKMLNVYDCPESKRPKRARKLEILKSMVISV